MRLRFVAAPWANLFMVELLEVLAAEARAAGCDAQVVHEFSDDAVHVVIPHEFEGDPTDAQLARTIALCVEQPGTPWFDIAYGHARRMGARVDINPVGLLGLRAYGLTAQRLQLGWSQQLDGWGGDAPQRDVEILYMGSAARRREVVLSSYAATLWPRERHLLMIPPHTAKTAARADFVVGSAKHELLARTQVLLSVRRQAAPYFEWVRALDAICNGAVFVCEHGAGHAPLRPGVHFVSGAPENLALLADALVRDPERQERIRRAAYALVRDEIPLRQGIGTLLDIAERLAGAHPGPTPPKPPAPDPPPPDAATVDSHDIGAKERALQEIRDRRARARAAVPDPDALEEVRRTPAYDAAEPEVSICIPAYHDQEVVADAVRSAVAQDLERIEILVHDDASTDGTAAAAAAALPDHVPGIVWRRAVNAGLPVARNTMAQRARAALVVMLDADNELLPPFCTRLAAALHADADATFAYATLACHRDGEPDGLLSTLPWDPALFRDYNYIDALAMLRREALLALGGYTTDERLHGWEDYELWVRIAASGGHGAHVPQMLARYRRTAGGSMLSLTDLDTAQMREILRERAPQVMA